MTPYEFEARLIRPEGVGTWTFLNLPREVSQDLGIKGQINVSGTINGHPFQTSARPHGDGTHYIVVNKTIRDAIRVAHGDVVHIVMQKDTAPRVVKIAADFSAALRDKQLSDTFEALSYSRRKEFSDWIESAKRSDTRTRRIDESIDMLLEGSSPKKPKR